VFRQECRTVIADLFLAYELSHDRLSEAMKETLPHDAEGD
jgi:hypothetical protein